MVSFKPPRISVKLLEADLDKVTPLTLSLSEVPDINRLTSTLGSLSKDYNNHQDWIKIVVFKHGFPVPNSANLCGATFGTWKNPQCVLEPAAVTNVVVGIQVKDYHRDKFVAVPDTHVYGRLTHKCPLQNAVRLPGRHPDEFIDFGQLSLQDGPKVELLGSKLPHPRHLKRLEIHGHRNH